MSAVWRTARAAMGRRRLQTFVIGLVVLLSTATIVVALALLDASSAPFDRAFAAHKGAHVVAAYDSTKVTNEQLLAQRDGVAASAGPFGQTTLEPEQSPGPIGGGPLTVVGRSDPGGPVDELDLWQGRWAKAPGEIVLNEPPLSGRTGPPPPSSLVAGGVTYTIVGRAYSISRSADAWVTPEQMAALKPTIQQMLYRFSGDVSTKEAVTARLTAVTAGLPKDGLVATLSYLVVKEKVAAGPGTYVPLFAAFGALGLVVAVLIVANVVSGAVVSGFRHIGVLKALGFTPRQVAAVYLLIVSVPALVGCVLGTVGGDLATRPLLADAFQGLGLGGGIGASAWVWVAALVGIPALVALAALVPVNKARRLSAAAAITAGSAPRAGRGLGAQRRLSRTRLPRPVSLGLGLPFARPGRTGLTLAAVLLGVTTVTFATGIANTLAAVAALSDRVSGDVMVRAFGAMTGPAVGPPNRTGTTRSDAEIEALLRGLPHTARVAALLELSVSAVGQSQALDVVFGRGDVAGMGYKDQLQAGRWMAQPDEVVAPTQLLRERGLAVGDKLTLELDGRRKTVTIVGQILRSPPGRGQPIIADWRALTDLAPNYQAKPGEMQYQVQLDKGASRTDYATAVEAADSGLGANADGNDFEFQVIVVSFSTVLATLLAIVAGLGVLNTVALNVHERRRDLGMLKSIGMTPRQVVAMMVTSMAAVGLVGGLLGIPLGILGHHFVIPLAADAVFLTLPASVMQVWHPLGLALFVLSGLAIAVLGALLPARNAARLTIATVLHNE